MHKNFLILEIQQIDYNTEESLEAYNSGLGWYIINIFNYYLLINFLALAENTSETESIVFVSNSTSSGS